jgi:hypothetical protein
MLHTGYHSYEQSQKIKGTFLVIYIFVKLCLSSLEQLVDSIRRTSRLVQEEVMNEDGTGDKFREERNMATSCIINISVSSTSMHAILTGMWTLEIF